MLNPCRVALVVALAVGAVQEPGAARAQLPQPRLQSVFPPGAGVGRTVELTVRGTDLEGVSDLWFDHPGLSATHVKDLTFRVTCAPGTTLGEHDVRAVSALGVSNPRTFVVGDRLETNEAEPNDSLDRANPLGLNSVVNGEIGPTDVDCFAFEGEAGRRVFLDLAAERIDSRLDATLRVYNSAGQEIAESRDVNGADPFLDLTLPGRGRYVVKVHDVIFGGSHDHFYRLTLHQGPHLDAIEPTVALAGVTTQFTLVGRLLGGLPAPDLSVGGRPLERKRVTIDAPRTYDPAPSHATRGNLPSSAAQRRGFEYVLDGPSGMSNPVFIAEAIDPVVLDREPNGDPDHAQTVTLPCDISGTFGAPNDLDIFRFHGHKGDVWWIEASAEHLGSQADPVILVQKIGEKGLVQDLLTGDDLPDQGGAARFNMSTVDAAVRWQVPEDGAYQVVVNDLYSSQRGDPRLVYRLNIRPERPDFRLFVVPRSPNATDSLTLRAGGRASAYVLASRIDGFHGPIRVEARSLPSGVTCAPVVIADGQSLAPIVFEAAENARPTVGIATLVGQARSGDRKEDLLYVAGATRLGPDVEHEALAGGMIWPPRNAQAPTNAPARVTRGLVLTVREPAPLTLTAKPAVWIVAQGRQLNLDLAVTRRAGFSETVTVTGSDLPPNVVNTAVTIAKVSDKSIATLFVGKDAATGIFTFLLRGTGAFPFSKDANSSTKPNVSLDEPSNPITLVVRPAPVRLSVEGKGGTLKPGGQLNIDVTISRQNEFREGLTLSLSAPGLTPLSASPVTVAAGETTARLVIRAAPESPLGVVAPVFVRAVARVRSAEVEVDEPLSITIIR